MRHHVSVLLGVLLASAALAGCDGDSSSTTSTAGAGGTGATGGAGGQGGSAPVCGDGLLAGNECDDGNQNAGDGCDQACNVEPGYACFGEPSDCLTTCGDGVLAGEEKCDDGGADSADGCSGECVIEPGYTCDGAPSVCVTTCGDGVLAGAEACDDMNIAPLDGCDAACIVEDGYACAGAPSVCATTCGDGNVGGFEVCDDGNADPLDGCDGLCLVEEGYTCTDEPSACVTTCGDGVIAGDEICDDGDAASGDGCSDQCAVEDGWTCAGEASACVTMCGDGIVAGMEACDDGDQTSADGCSATCAVEAGYVCDGEPSACATVCGDGVIAGMEVCDDGDGTPGDGCSAMCAVEAGFYCSGAPSACVTQCGDAITAGAEGCDDGSTAAGDGCSAMCAVEAGFYCSGVPSACVTQCGDGIQAGLELCDDGNQVNGDGCSTGCIPNSGETCAEALLMSQAQQMGGKYTWTVAQGAVLTADGAFACDPNGLGPDVVVKYTKTSDTLANGGQLLHVKADTPGTTTSTYFLNLEVKGGACAAGAGTSHKCNWSKDNWDAYLDVPPGDYWIWVGKNSAATVSAPFPQVTILAEEIAPAAAPGEGCFAPYTTMSANYTPPGGAGLPHTWTIADGAINSFDMGATWGEPGSISCDNTSPYGDIHGVDAVVEYNKQFGNSVLKIDVQNLDPVLSQSDLNVEVLSVCDATSPSKVSRHCRANRDTISITAPAPAGASYVWVATEGTSEELNGATVQITEIFPGVGESWPTAQSLAGSGPITPTSMQRLDAPSCFPAAGNIHWYSYTLTNDAMSLAANLAGVVGVYDGAGQEVACVADAAASPVGVLGDPGDTFYIAVLSPSTVTSFTIQDVVYSGVQGVATDMNITFPSTATTEYGMAVDGNQIVMGGLTNVFSFPKAGNATAVAYGTANGITSTHLGYDIVFAGGSLFSVDGTTTVNVNRLFRIFDGATGVWGPGTPWDLTPSYPTSSASHALATDGTTLFMSTRRTTANTDVNLYSFSPGAASAPTLLGVKAGIWYVTGMAVDATYFYLAGNGTAGEGVYRVERANLAAPAVKIATIDTNTLCNNIEVDSYVAPQHLYVRDTNGNTHAVVGPGGANPTHIGAISTLGTSSDFAMTYDPSAGVLYLFETETDSAGRIVQLQ